ncbi:MAG: aminoglycoside phosphotransferase family protein [Clostridia bacterium]|nr:aminoglycoside phosphotransferase family protein [Clostridia bacterium]
MKYFTVNDDFKSIIEKEIGKTNNISQISTGWTNFVFEVDGESGEYIFRFPRNDFFSDVLEKEVSFSKFIKGKIKTPTSNIRMGFDKGRPFTCHSKIKGKSLTSAYSTLSIDDKKRIADQVSEFIYELQQIPIENIPLNLPTTSEFLENLSHVDNEYYDFSKHDNLIKLEQGDLVLNHADLNPGNILIDENKNVCAIIDFAFVSKSSDLNDVSRLIGRLPEDFHEIMLNSYNSRFNKNILMDKIHSLISVWNYVEEHYINYMRVNQPEIDIGR